MQTNSHLALLLEDEALIAMDLEISLQSVGLEVVHLMSCTDADKWLDAKRPDVAIVDIQLNDGSCQEIVQRLHDAGVPVVVHSGDLPQQHFGTPFENGIWVNKPTALIELIRAVRQALKQD